MVAIVKGGKSPSAPAQGAGPLHDLIREISQATAPVGERAPAPHGHDRMEQILVDVEVDGDRYLLIRIPLAQRPSVSLSPREWEIVRMVAQGHPNKRIAMLLNLSVWTI